MKPAGCALPLLLVLMELLIPAAAAGVPCALPPDLYARRRTLKRQYSEQVGSEYLSHKAVAARIKAQLRLVHRPYQEFFSQLCRAADVGNADRVAECCANTDGDPLAGEVCNLAYYLSAKRADSTRFVQTFPHTQQEIAMLWELDEITFGPQGLLVNDCGPSGLVDRYIDELFNLAARDNGQALTKVVNLSHYAEGVYGEGLADRMKRLFLEEPRLVLDRWPIIRKFSHIQYLGAEFVDDERATAEQNFRKLCARPSQACTEIMRAISSQ